MPESEMPESDRQRQVTAQKNRKVAIGLAVIGAMMLIMTVGTAVAVNLFG